MRLGRAWRSAPARRCGPVQGLRLGTPVPRGPRPSLQRDGAAPGDGDPIFELLFCSFLFFCWGGVGEGGGGVGGWNLLLFVFCLGGNR